MQAIIAMDCRLKLKEASRIQNARNHKLENPDAIALSIVYHLVEYELDRFPKVIMPASLKSFSSSH
jgi:hypothetical protein